MKGYCGFCKEWKQSAKGSRNCPECKAFLSKSEDDPKKSTASVDSSNLDKKFQVNIAPPDLEKLDRMQKAGIITDVNEVLRRGIIAMESGYLNNSHAQSTQPNSKKVENNEDTFAAMEQMMASKLKIQNMRTMMSENDGNGLPMKDLIQMMLVKEMMKGKDSDNSELSMLKMQIQQRDQQIAQQQMDSKFQQIISAVESKGRLDDTSAKDFKEMQLKHEQSLERMRNEASKLQNQNFQQTLNHMEQKIKEKSKSEGWTKKIEDIFTEKATAALAKSFEKGLSGTEPEKKPMEYIGDIIGNVTQQLAPAMNAYAQNKYSSADQFSQPQQTYFAPPQTAQPNQSPPPEQTSQVQQPTDEFSSVPQKPASETGIQDSPESEQPGGNAVSNSDYQIDKENKNDEFSG